MPLVLRQKFEENAIPLVGTGQALEDSPSQDLLVVLMAVAVAVEEVEEAAMVVEVVEVDVDVEVEVARDVLLFFEGLYLLVGLHDQPCISQW